MFDVGFWELGLVFVIALVVFGPERLPSIARTLGLWLGRARRYTQELRDELEEVAGSTDLRSEFESAREDIRRRGRHLRKELEGDNEGHQKPDQMARREASGGHAEVEHDGGQRVQEDARGAENLVGNSRKVIVERGSVETTRPLSADVKNNE